MTEVFLDDEEYEEMKDMGCWPEELEDYRHSLDWPLKKNVEKVHISNYPRGKQYCRPERDWHPGVDIHGQHRDKVKAVEESRLVKLITNGPGEHLAGMCLRGEETNIIYKIYHLDKKSTTGKISEKRIFDLHTDTTVEKGEVIGEIGEWPVLVEDDVEIPKGVKEAFGREHDHVHINIQYYPEGYPTDSLNPLLLFQDFRSYFGG